jgi:hypothetical protein
MLTRAAIAAAFISLLSSSAFAGATQGRFSVGAVVVASATVTSSVVNTARGGVEVRVAKRGTPQPMLLMRTGLNPMTEGGTAELPAPASGDMTVTVLY